MRRITYSLLLSLTAVAAACGGDDGDDGDNNNPDAPPSPDAPSVVGCGTPVTTITTYPSTYEGVVLGAGNDLTVDDGACADQRDYYGSSGDDHVIALTGLTPGARYLLQLTTQEDIMMYVTEDCSGGQPSSGSCLLLVDQTTRNEVGDFMAPADGTVTVVIDTPDDVDLTTGMYTLAIREAACLSSFDCEEAATPVCDLMTNTCVAGGTMCTGDDVSEPDDGPANARTVTYPTAAPTVLTGAVCNVPATESDWFRITAPGPATLRIAATWTNAVADLDFIVYDETGEAIATADAVDFDSEIALVDLPAAGTYFVELYAYDPMNTAAATSYTLTIGEPECETSFDCTSGANPVCDTGGCVAGPGACTGDDLGDTTPGTSDDGPAGARVVAIVADGVPVTMTGSACNVPEGAESDWYRVTTTANGQGLTARLSWTAMTGIDLDVYIFDATGNLVGMSFWVNPEVVTTTYLPMGTYYVNVVRFDSPMTTPEAAYAYSLEVTRTAAQTCTTSTDCADEHMTQIYRGTCAANGTCTFIPPGTGANGTGCDSGDDCMTGDCSYIVFEADAQKSVCTTSCTATPDCAALGASYTCTTGFQTNICVPACAADLECGANLGSGTLDPGLPWNFLTCTLPAGTCGP